MEWDLEDLIRALKEYPADHPSPVTWGPCSHRWDYSQLAFVLAYEACTVGDLLEKAMAAIGATYKGYKGGAYLMDLKTEVFATNCHSEVGSPIGPQLLYAWLGPVPVVLPQGCRHDDAGRRRWSDGGASFWFTESGGCNATFDGVGFLLSAGHLEWLRGE